MSATKAQKPRVSQSCKATQVKSFKGTQVKSFKAISSQTQLSKTDMATIHKPANRIGQRRKREPETETPRPSSPVLLAASILVDATERKFSMPAITSANVRSRIAELRAEIEAEEANRK